MKIMESKDQKDVDFIRSKLIEYNMAKLPEHLKSPFEKVSIVLRKEDNDIAGGILGTLFWGHLHIDFFWIDESMRHSGYGTQLLKRIEDIAVDKGCRLISLDTFSFQAPDFYQKNGYTVFGVLEDHPKGYNQYFLEKRLT